MDHSLPMNDYQLWLNLEFFIPHPWETHQLPTLDLPETLPWEPMPWKPMPYD